MGQISSVPSLSAELYKLSVVRAIVAFDFMGIVFFYAYFKTSLMQKWSRENGKVVIPFSSIWIYPPKTAFTW